MYSETCLKRPLKKKTKLGFQDRLSHNAAPREHSAILSTFILLPFVFKIFVLSIFEWSLKTCFTVKCTVKLVYNGRSRIDKSIFLTDDSLMKIQGGILQYF